jgi:hypothetical protein
MDKLQKEQNYKIFFYFCLTIAGILFFPLGFYLVGRLHQFKIDNPKIAKKGKSGMEKEVSVISDSTEEGVSLA